ncbi:MAG: tetratricopeptide repeat protein [Caldilineaceae bacterium]
MIKSPDFQKQLKYALKWFHDPTRLGQESPLASTYFLGGASQGMATASAERRGRALQEQLLQAAATLWEGEPPQSRLEMQQALAAVRQQPDSRRYAYLVLELRAFHRFLKPRKLADVWESDDFLPGSRAEHYRDYDLAVEQLGQALLAQQPPAFHQEQPEPPPNLIGYSAHLQEVLRQLASEGAPSLAVTGASGVGKSALAATAAARLAERPLFWFHIQPELNDNLNSLLFALGQFLHSLGAAQLWQHLVANRGRPEDPNLVLGFTQADLRSVAAAQPLLIFDELEHLHSVDVENASEQHTQLLNFIGQLRTRATLLLISQRPLLEADGHVDLSGLAMPQIQTLWQEAGLALSAAELAELFAHTGGNLRLLLLYRSLHLKGEPPLEALSSERHVSALMMALNRLWPRLQPPEWRILQQLCVYRTWAPEYLWQSESQALDTLVAMRLVQRNGRGGIGLPPAWRAVIYAELTPELREQLHLDAAAAQLVHGDYTTAAYHLARGGDDGAAIHAWYPYRMQELQRGRAAAAQHVFHGMSNQRLRKREREILRLIRAELHQFHGDAKRGLAELEQSDWPAQSEVGIRTKALEADFLDSLGYPYRAAQSYQAALAASLRLLNQMSSIHLRSGLLHLRRTEHAQARREAYLAQYDAHCLTGVVHQEEGRFAEAHAAYQTALTLAERLEDEARLARLHRYLSILHGKQQKFDEAMHHADRAIEFYERVGDRLNSHVMRNNLSAHYLYARQFAQVVAVGEEALPFFRSMGQPYWVASTASNVAEAYYELGDWESAIRYAQETLNQEEPQLIPYGLHTLGLVALAQTQFTRAADYFQAVIRAAQKSADAFREGYGWRNLGKVYTQVGELTRAREAFENSLRLFRHLGIEGEAALTQQEMAQLDALPKRRHSPT